MHSKCLRRSLCGGSQASGTCRDGQYGHGALGLWRERLHWSGPGDSRAYLYRNSQLSQITEDHSLVQEQLSAGLITEEQARYSMVRNIITRSIGFESEVEVDLFVVPARVGDQFILCSDGISNLVEDHEMQDLLAVTERRKLPATLIELANRRGGDDNSTVVWSQLSGGAERKVGRKLQWAKRSDICTCAFNHHSESGLRPRCVNPFDLHSAVPTLEWLHLVVEHTHEDLLRLITGRPSFANWDANRYRKARRVDFG